MKHTFLWALTALSGASLAYPAQLAHDQTIELSERITEIITRRKEGGLTQGAKEVLLHFGKVLSNFFNLLQDTQNPQHVGTCVQGMLTEMVNVGVAAIQNRAIRIEDGVVTLPEVDVAALLDLINVALAHLKQNSDYISPDLSFVALKLSTTKGSV